MFIQTACFGESYFRDLNEEEYQQSLSAYKAGVAYARAQSYDKAIESFKKAISINPEMTDAYYNIASIYISQKKYDDAYSVYTKIISINPHDYDAILQAAKISYNRKNYSLAMKYLKHIPYDYDRYSEVQQLYNDAASMFDSQKGKIERSKVSTANKNKAVLLDKLTSPAGVVVDSEGNMFVASYTDNAIIKIAKDNSRSNFVKDYLLEGPVGLAIDAYDNLYVANFDGNNILKITKGGNVSVFMDKVSGPYILYIKNDILYISEQGNDAVLIYGLYSSK